MIMTNRESLLVAVFFSMLSVGSLCLAIAVWPRRRFAAAADPLMALLLAIAWWCGSYAMSFSHVSIATAGFWLDQTYWGSLVAPTALLFFVARYSKRDGWLTPAMRRTLVLVPMLVAVAIYAPPLRRYFFGEGRNPVTAVLDHPGITYWLYLAYASCLMLFANTIVVRFLRDHGDIRRKSGPLLLLATALPWAASLVSSFSPLVFGVDPTVVSLGVTTAILAYLVLSRKILDIRQLAREQILNAMRDGFIAVDDQQRVVDVNERALQLLDMTLSSVLHQPIVAALAERKSLLDAAFVNGGGLVRINAMTAEQLLLVETLPLNDRDGVTVGTVVVLRDQTRLYVDELTKIGNRRYFFDQVPLLVSVCQRSNLPVSLAIIDLDGLKTINDALGHPMGDEALVRVAAAVRSQVRSVDVVARMSGDEFVALMPDADEVQAAAIAERIRGALAEDWQKPFVSVSVGVAQIAAEDSLLHAIAAADRALYSAKTRGRDCVVRFSEDENQP